MGISVRSWRCGWLVTWFCYYLKAKLGDTTATPSWPETYTSVNEAIIGARPLSEPMLVYCFCTHGKNPSEILITDLQQFSHKEMGLKMSSAKWRLFMLRPQYIIIYTASDMETQILCREDLSRVKSGTTSVTPTRSPLHHLWWQKWKLTA